MLTPVGNIPLAFPFLEQFVPPPAPRTRSAANTADAVTTVENLQSTSQDGDWQKAINSVIPADAEEHRHTLLQFGDNALRLLKIGLTSKNILLHWQLGGRHMNGQRLSWFDLMFSTEPANREAAISGVRAFYEAAELDAPQHLIWLDSPAEACYAALALCSQHDSFLERIAAAFEKMAPQRAEMARACEKAAQSAKTDWRSLASVAGVPLTGMSAPARDDIQGKITGTRLVMWGDATAAMGNVAEDELFQAQGRFWSVIAGALPTLNTMLQGCASRKYHLMWMAMDEAAMEKGMSAPPLLKAAWAVARSAGPWWPFRNAAIITERPLEVHRNAQWLLERGDGPAVVYRDGWKLFAWNGESMPRKWIEQPESIPSRQLKQADKRFQEYVSTRAGVEAPLVSTISTKPSDIFKKNLPSEVAEKIQFLRNHLGGRSPFYDRYMVGDCEGVWKELIGLKAVARAEPYAADALAVAYETMRRVRENVQTLVGRLHGLGYRFSTEQSEWEQQKRSIESVLSTNVPVSEIGLRSPHVRRALDMMEGAKQMARERLEASEKVARDTSVRAHVQPTRDVAKQIRKLEKKLGTLPLSLRAFYEVVGSVDLIGQHATLTPRGSSISPDPLVVSSAEDALADSEFLEADDDDRYVFIAPDDIHKAGESGGEPYQIAVPDERADSELLSERHGMFFVEYLRMAFRWGGFPGYEGHDRDVPDEIGDLRAGLLEI